MKIRLRKALNSFVPDDPQSQEFCDKVKIGSVIHGNFTKERNPGFHRKLFALLNLAFQYWQPGELSDKYGTPEKNFDQFREDVTILAGFYERFFRLDGSVRVKAKSIAWGKMDGEEFEKLYQAILTVIIEKIMPEFDSAEVDEMVEQSIMEFA